MTSCQCEACQQKRTLFTQCLHGMAGGIGKTKKKALKSIHAMPDNFIHDLRKLLTRLRRSPDAKLTPQQLHILQAHRFPLRRFIMYDPRELLAVKRRVDGHLIPLAQAIGHLLSSNPKLIKQFIDNVEAH